MLKFRFLFVLLVIGLDLPARGAELFDRTAEHELSLGRCAAERVLLSAQRHPSRSSLSTNSTDYQLSAIAAPAAFTQDNPCVKFISGGEWLVVWQDERLGASKIFLQTVDSNGVVQGANQVIAGSPVGADFVEPRVKVDSLGRIYLFYRDRTDGLIFGSRFGSNLAVDLAPFIVNDTAGAAFAGPFDFDVYPDGRLVAVWENYSGAGSSIQMRIYTPTGASAYGPNTANSDGGAVSHWVPSVAVQPGSGYLVAWEDYRNGQADIYARQFNGSGSPVASEFGIVPPGPESSAQYAPRVGYSSVDRYLIAWADLRLGQEIYLQQFDPISGLVGSNQLVSSGDTLVTNWDLDVSVSLQGKYCLTWGSFGQQNLIVCRRYGTGVVAAGSIETKNLSLIGQRWAPSTDFQRADRYAVAWTEYLNGDANINFMLFDTLNTRILPQELRLNDDSQGAPADEPSISAADWRLELVAFVSRRHDDGDIYVQTISHSGVLQYSNQRVNLDSGYTLQSEPSVAVAGNRSLVVWVDSRSIQGASGQRVFGRFGSNDGIYSSPDFAVSDSFQSAVKTEPKTILNRDGRGLVCWIDKRNGTPQVYGRWLSSAGALDGAEFLITTPASDIRNSDLNVASDSIGRFYVVWMDDGSFPTQVKGKWYNPDKSSGGSFSYSSDISGSNIQHISTAVNDSGIISIAWIGASATLQALYTTSITRSGTLSISTLMVTDSADANPSDPSISVDENRYQSIVWIDRRNGIRQAYYQMYTSGAAALGANQPVSSTNPEFMANPVTSAYRGRVWFAWSDPRQHGLQVYGNNLVYLPTEVDNGGGNLPVQFALSQNFPNPFNPSTEISFSVPRRSRVTLSVYDLLGREVIVLADGMFEAGDHRVRWHGTTTAGTPVASGVYLYRLSGDGFSETRKMMLLK